MYVVLNVLYSVTIDSIYEYILTSKLCHYVKCLAIREVQSIISIVEFFFRIIFM